MPSAMSQELTDQFIQFYRGYCKDEIADLAQKYPNERRSLYIDYDDLYVYDPDLAEDYLSDPDQMKEYAEEALELYDLPADVSLGGAHVRLVNLPESIDIRSIRVHDGHVGGLVSIQGIVRKATDVRPQITEAVFDCQRCGTENVVGQIEGDFEEPHECHGCEREGPFKIDFNRSTFVDAQKIRIQESPEDLRGGETPQSIDMDIEDDITGKVTPGGHVTVVGVLHIDQMGSDSDKSKLFDLRLDGVSIALDDEGFDNMDLSDDDINQIEALSNREDIYEKMVGSVAPSIYGYDQEKLAMILQLFTGVTKHLPDGSRIRGDIHMLLIGDPGTGKSKLLGYVGNISPRSIYTSGKGSSSAGLTASAVRDSFSDGEQWSLEAGALVLADKGIAAVDELDKMEASDRSAMHQALEQQEVSISKAGINATLKSRCSLLAAANPKYGRFDPYESPGQQIDLEPALMSRFDLIFTVTDQPDPDHDGKLADHIIETNYAGELNTQMNQVTDSSVTEEEVEAATRRVSPEIEPELLRKYIAYAKRGCFPAMTDEARSVIRDFYVDLRGEGVDDDEPIPVTARKLEALVRLAEASARVRLAGEVSVSDAERAVDIVRSCLRDVGIDPETGEFDVDTVETGQSKTQRDRVRGVKSIIEELEGTHEEGAPVGDVIDMAKESGMDEVKVEEEIETLQGDGSLYEPTRGYLRTL